MVAFDGAKVETLASPACTPMRGRCASASSKLLQSDGADHRCISGDGRVTLVESREAKGRPARVEPSVERRCEAFCWRRPANLGEPKHLQRRCEAGRLEDHQRLLHNCFQSASRLFHVHAGRSISNTSRAIGNDIKVLGWMALRQVACGPTLIKTAK
jgi:hypothetical protein